MSASESSTLQANTPVATNSESTLPAKVPTLGEGFQEPAKKVSSKPKNDSDSDPEADGKGAPTDPAKARKRRLFGLGKKIEDKMKGRKGESNSQEGPASQKMKETTVQPLPRKSSQNSSPPRSNHPYQLPASPNRNLYSSSPRVVSPAGSQIFERDVQDSTLPVPNSPAIPSHIQTENYVPPVLDASTEAITNNKLDPDSVEIVMHSHHQPAAVTVTGVGSPDVLLGHWTDDLASHPAMDREDTASSYGALDSTDVRRLSFISFADVVQSEHAEHTGNRDSVYIAGLSSLSSAINRSPSPVRSPVSSQGFGTSPPTSKSASVKGLELSPGRKPLASPTINGELAIETMSQALRRTGSGDLSGVRSLPLSPISPDGLSDRSYK
ncbi:hypothetical protein F5884DRAFT_67753 [Xylogone sp. PMI_703]|nr:hypothetical protein F5884DRAFT_67753 [Xylogone sp. PMI_703]